MQELIAPNKRQINKFLIDTKKGLSENPKRIDSKYFYDEEGSRLFQKIMHMPEYYLTDCEFEIFDQYKSSYLDTFIEGTDHFNLIEFGAGDGLKTKLLLKHFVNENANFQYLPIDISSEAVDYLVNSCKTELPDLHIEGICDDYFSALHSLRDKDRNTRDVILFVGSNIGNFEEDEAINFLKAIRSEIGRNDLLVIGFDLKKDPEIILKAYNDSHGITRQFNMNLLSRMNRELGADFDISKFKHYPNYDPISGATRSFIISLEEQKVNFGEGFSILFDKAEPIYTEISQKYDSYMISKLAESSGFNCKKRFLDSREYFVSEVWEAV